jgi:hypothetical protein
VTPNEVSWQAIDYPSLLGGPPGTSSGQA